MNHEAMPLIRLEVEQMKSTILTHLGAHNSEMGEVLKVEIEKVIESYDWQGKVTEIVHTELTKQVADYFKYGQGHDLVKAAVTEGFDAVLGTGV
ncbi:MAG: hypothetical protein PVI43_00330 [Candidatus Bathyarchaeota archaeon]|jgi:hypothetical protein